MKSLTIRVILFLIVMGGIATLSFRHAHTKRIETAQTMFHALGYDTFAFTSIESKGNEYILKDAHFDANGFITAKEIKISFVSFFTNPLNAAQVSYIEINGFDKTTLLHEQGAWSSFFDKLLFEGMLKQNIDNLIIKNAHQRFNALDIGGIDIAYELKASKADDQTIEISGRFNTTQKSLKAQGIISGTTERSGISTLNFETQDLFINSQNISAKRGIASLKASLNAQTLSLTSNFKFPAMSWRNFPLQNVIGQINKTNQNSYFDVQLNGNTTGEEAIEWRSHYSRQNLSPVLKLTIIPKTFGALRSYLERNNTIQNVKTLPSALENIESPNITISLNEHNQVQYGGVHIALSDSPFTLRGNYKRNIDDGALLSKFSLENGAFTFNNSLQLSLNQKLVAQIALKPKKGSAPIVNWAMRQKLFNTALEVPPFKINLKPTDKTYNNKAPFPEKMRMDFTLPYDIQGQKGRLDVDTTNPQNIRIENINYNIFGGKISTKAAIEISRNADQLTELPLIVEEININKLFHALGFKDIVASGSMTGNLPLRYNKQSKIFHISNAILQSEGPGTIKIPPAIVAQIFPRNAYNTENLAKNLANYNFDFFEIRLDGKAKGTLLFTLKASGQNPLIAQNLDDRVDIDLQIETSPSTFLQNILN